MPGINFQQVSFGYLPKQAVVKQISFSIKPGDFFGITGTNGSGKTTLLYLLNGLIPQVIKGSFQGRILINNFSTRDYPVSFFSKTIGLVFQNPDFSLFNLTVKEELEFSLKNFRLPGHENRIKKALKQVKMFKYLNADPQTLSFGQKQKICLATALALNPDYLVLDEPTAMLDYRSSVELYQILKTLNADGKTIIVVEHDTDFLLQNANRILILDQGQIKALGTAKKILSNKTRLKTLGIKIPHS